MRRNSHIHNHPGGYFGASKLKMDHPTNPNGLSFFTFPRASLKKNAKSNDIAFHTSRDYFTALEAGHFTLDPAKLNDPNVCDNFRTSS